MFKKLIALAIFLPFLTSITFVRADVQVKKAEQPTQIVTINAKELDPRAVILKDYLAQYNSPLQNNAQDFIDAADRYQIDWRLVPAISGVESTFGKQIPGGYNGWGWGVYGDQAIYFNSWRDAIFTISAGLKENYIDQGLTNPYTMNPKYAASPYWGSHVDYFLKDIDKFAQNHQQGVFVASANDNNKNLKLKQVLELKHKLAESGSKPEIQANTVINPDRLALNQ